MAMDHKDFINKLSEYAELKAIRPPITCSVRQAPEPDTVFRGGQEWLIDTKENPTLNIGIKRLKSQPRACEDCGLVVKDRVVTQTVYLFPKKHWRIACSGCRKVKNPETGDFDIEARRAQNHFTSILKEKK